MNTVASQCKSVTFSLRFTHLKLVELLNPDVLPFWDQGPAAESLMDLSFAIMTSAATESQKHNTSPSRNMSRGLADFPTEIVRLIFEVSVTPASGRRAEDDQERQRSAYACCLVSKAVRAWVEPILYAKVVLESRNQILAFLDTLEFKSTEFLTRTVKTVWVLNDSFPDDSVNRFHRLFTKCQSLRNFACLGAYLCGQILRFIPKPQNGTRTLRELTIIQAELKAASSIDFTHLSIQRLQIIDCSKVFAADLCHRASTDKLFLDTLRAIPHISFDFAVVPEQLLTYLIRVDLIPLLIRGTPESKSVLNLRSIPIPSHRFPVYSWVEAFDTDVRQCGGRLLVCLKSDSELGINPGASYIERRRRWIGLD